MKTKKLKTWKVALFLRDGEIIEGHSVAKNGDHAVSLFASEMARARGIWYSDLIRLLKKDGAIAREEGVK